MGVRYARVAERVLRGIDGASPARYNAEKKKVGNYYSTPIYSFRCKCHLCGHWFSIETDPKVSLYQRT